LGPIAGNTLARLAGTSIKRRLGARYPYFCSWYVTSKCTTRCEGCVFFERLRTSGPDLSRVEALGVVDELAGSGLPVLIFVGGEPLLRPDLSELLKRAKRRGMYTVIFTNGAPITPDITRRLSPNLDVMIVSLDGFGHGHDTIRGRGSFASAWQGLNTYISHRAFKKSLVYANIGLHKGSINTVPMLVHELLSSKVDKIKLQPNFIPSFKPDPKEALLVVDFLENSWVKNPDRFAVDKPYLDRLRTYFERDDNREYCGAPSLAHIAVLPDGTVSACCDFLLPMGSLREKNLQKILKTDPVRLREQARHCAGCCRRDYMLVQDFLDAPLRNLTLSGLTRALKGYVTPA